MPALVHNSFRISNAKQFKESFSELKDFGIGFFVPNDLLTANSSMSGGYDVPSGLASGIGLGDIPINALDDQIYLFIGRVTPWMPTDQIINGVPDTSIDENNPPSPIDSVKHGNFDHWDDMIAAKKVSGGDVSHVIKRERADEISRGMRGWESGNRYHEYDDRREDLFDDDSMLHALNDRFRVYKCIKRGIGKFYNSGNSANGEQGGWLWDYMSYDEPQGKDGANGDVTDNHMVSGKDGYQWKFLYTIAAGEALKFVTTSYIPVRTIRKENGFVTQDNSDQYDVETSAVNGAILNVMVDKKEIVDSATIKGYEPIGGDGYVQLASPGAGTTAIDLQTGSLTVEFTIGAITPCDFPHNAADVALLANNKFDFSTASTETNDLITNALPNTWNLEGYGVVFTQPYDTTTYADSSRYVYPISNHVEDGAGTVTLTIDPTFVTDLQTAGVLPSPAVADSNWSTTAGSGVEIHPRVGITSNHDSSSSLGTVNSLQAYAVVEPFYDHAATPPVYKQDQKGRIIDVRVLNPGKDHRRIDSATILPDISANANTANVHACVAPVGGHGFDPVAELGGYNVMINARFEGTEGGEFSVGNEFRKIGILKNPMTWSANTLWMSPKAYHESFSSTVADQCYRVSLGNTSVATANTLDPLAFQFDMNVGFLANTGTYNASYVGEGFYDSANVVASATVVDYDPTDHSVRLIKPRGDFGSIFKADGSVADFCMISIHSVTHPGGNHSSYPTPSTVEAVANGVQYTNPDMKPGSGNILYLENRTTVSRSQNQSEDLKISISF